VVSQGDGKFDILDPTTNRLTKAVAVGKLPHWFALDAKGNTAWVTNEGSNDLSVVDINTGTVIATIPVGNAPRKIVMQQQLVTSGRDALKTMISGFAFAPILTVKAGQTIIWTNNDAVPHTVTSDAGLWDSGDINPGQSYELTFAKPGTYSYHCMHHPYMKGVVNVST
jgi:YVTN family beta-propeller protein